MAIIETIFVSVHKLNGKTSDQPHCLIICRSFVLDSWAEDSLSLPTNKHIFHPRAIKGRRKVCGGYSIIMHYLFRSNLICSYFCVDLDKQCIHTKKSCISELTSSLPLIMSSSNSFSFQTKPNPLHGIQTKIWASV